MYMYITRIDFSVVTIRHVVKISFTFTCNKSYLISLNSTMQFNWGVGGISWANGDTAGNCDYYQQSYMS